MGLKWSDIGNFKWLNLIQYNVTSAVIEIYSEYYGNTRAGTADCQGREGG